MLLNNFLKITNDTDLIIIGSYPHFSKSFFVDFFEKKFIWANGSIILQFVLNILNLKELTFGNAKNSKSEFFWNFENLFKKNTGLETCSRTSCKTNISLLVIGILSKSLDEMTPELQQRVNTAENFSTDLVHEIRNPLASLKSASEILNETDDQVQRNKLVNILNHDVQRIERLITDYSQMLKDEVALSKEKMNIIDLKLVVKSVVDDFNSIYEAKRGIKIEFVDQSNIDEYLILGIENRIEQIIANLLDNSISFSDDNKKILVKIPKSMIRKQKRKGNLKFKIK